MKVGRSESPLDVLVVHDLDLKREELVQILHDDHKNRKFDAERQSRIYWTSDQSGNNIASGDFNNHGLNILISDPFDGTIFDFLVPNLKGIGSNRVQDGQKARLECVSKHCSLSRERNEHSCVTLPFEEPPVRVIDFEIKLLEK